VSGDGNGAMSEGVLNGVRVIEGSAFVAAPTAGMTLAQLGADVIRFDAPGGGLDWRRWPLNSDGDSLFWSGLQKGKRSIEVDLRSEEGREQLTQLITMPGRGNGIFLTNFPARGWMSYEKLKERRADLIMVVMAGNHDGSSEVDYTVNPSAGFPEAMGPRDSAVPTNSLMPAWDSIMGGLAVVGLLAALRHRDATGEGQLVEIALSDVAFATVGHLGRIAEVQLEGRDQPRDGNYLYGAFGGDFPTKDGRRVMVVALTGRQWKALKEATGTEAVVRRAHARRDPRDVRRDRRLLGALPDLQAARRGGPALLDRQPDVHDGRAPGRDVPHAGVTAALQRPRPPAGGALPAPGRAHRGGPRRAQGAGDGGGGDPGRVTARAGPQTSSDAGRPMWKPCA
jgi:crotonobetainyl-CoA:carnitine CoA-transferase CaiB-like acyl-CoA transferase